MTIFNNTGVLRKVMLCPPDFYEIVPVSDFSRTALERGDKVDHVKAQAQHDELAACLHDAGIEVCLHRRTGSHPSLGGLCRGTSRSTPQKVW